MIKSGQPYHQHVDKISNLKDIELWLLSTWEELLGITQLDHSADFFELGANSLALIKLISRIENHYGEMDNLLDSLLENSTIQQMANMIYQERCSSQ